MKAADVMVPNVVTVRPEASVEDVVEILLAHDISAVPVVARSGELMGIISEGDLLRHTETNPERRWRRWRALLTGQPVTAEFMKARPRRAIDVMTRDLITAMPDTSLRELAALLEGNHIRHVPIAKNGKLVGLVSRANLIQAVATERKPVKAAIATSDLMIRQDVLARLGSEPRNQSPQINVIVHDGTVELWGIVHSQAEKNAIEATASATPGVRGVHSNLVIPPAACICEPQPASQKSSPAVSPATALST